MREILTLQFGHFANFVGTHYWNTQESYFSSVQNENDTLDVDHDILFRTGQNPQGHETYTPRLLLFDLKGGFGSLPQHNELYSAGPEVESKTAWQHQVERHEQPAYSKNEYLQSLDVEHSPDAPRHYHNLDNTVNVWSDYNKLYYHPKSINTLNGFFHGDENAPFDIFSSGRDSFFEENWNEQVMEDHFRFFAEECDQLQGFQMFANMTDAFGGLATMFLEDLRDDFPKTPVMVYGCTDAPVNRLTVDNPKSILNVSFSTRMMNEYSSLYIPLILPTPTDLDPSHRTRFLRADLSLPYHSSSILAAAVETATLQFRTKHNPTMMGDFIDRLNWRQNTKVARLCTGFPLPVVHGHGKEILHSVFTGHKFGQTRDFMWDLSTREKPGSVLSFTEF
ncbi:Misato segment II tubulin-like domain-containing protein [Paraphysoderma sedebokerense]|nr:Misato segment II tubulin-like domain-containing protein [Paraphysoderma sedebokerense]